MTPIVVTNSSPSGRLKRVPAGAGGGGGGGSSETVNFLVTRWDGNSGTVAVFGAIPLKPGKVYASDLSKIVVRDNTGTEKQIAIQAATSRFPDNTTYANRSLRAVHVQFTHSVSNNAELVFTVEIAGASRTISDATYVEPIYHSATMTVPAMTHKATLFPDDPTYWCASFIALTPLIAESATPSSTAKTWFGSTTTGAPVTYMPRNMRGWWEAVIAAEGGDFQHGSATYEHPHGAYCAAVRAASRADRMYFYQRFWGCLIKQLGNGAYNLPASWVDSGGGNQYAKIVGWDASLTGGDSYGLPTEAKAGVSIGWAVGYLATGWSEPKRKIAHHASATWASASDAPDVAYYFKRQIIHPVYIFRFNAHLQTFPFLASYVVEATDNIVGGYGAGRNNDTYGFATYMPMVMTAFAENVWSGLSGYRNGIVGQAQTATNETETPPYLITWQLARATVNVLIFYWNNIAQDSRIPGWLEAIGTYTLNQAYYNGASTGFPYGYETPPITSIGNSEAYAYGPYFVELFGWLYAHTGNAQWKTIGDRVASNDGTTGGGHQETVSTKNVGEYFAGTCQSYLAYVNGSTTSPVTGAHTTQAPIDLPTRVF